MAVGFGFAAPWWGIHIPRPQPGFRNALPLPQFSVEEPVVPPVVAEPGGGQKRSRKHLPGITSNKAVAFREDEEILALLEAYFNLRHKL